MESWECFASSLFRPVGDGETNQPFVEQQCDGLGWGNSIQSLGISVEIAGMFGARLTFQRKIHHLWTFPNFSTSHPYISWNYEEHGRNEEDYSDWVRRVSSSRSEREKYIGKTIQPNICAMDTKIVRSGGCMSAAMPGYNKCIVQRHYEPILYNLPAFYAAFRKPTQLMADYLAKIRARLELPPIPAGMEPHPGSWGLYTPGYSVFLN